MAAGCTGVEGPRTTRFFTLPSTDLGRWSAWLLALSSVLLVMLNAAVLLPEPVQEVQLALPRRLAVLAILLCGLSAGASGLLALIKRRERSWVAFLSVLVLLSAVPLLIADIVHSWG